MATAREKPYLCTFASRSHRLVLRITAWDEADAARAFRDELKDRGITEWGEIEVLPVTRSAPVPLDLVRHAT